MTLFWIILTCVAGGLINLFFATLIAKKANNHFVENMVSLAVGTLLGAVFLEILPHAFEISNDYEQTTLVVLIGILIFFILEKLLIWRHCHGSHCEAHSSDDHLKRNKKGGLILIGDLFHNMVDGILITSAFLVDLNLGLVTALAIFAHEIPQEMGNFSVLLHSGLSRMKAYLFILITSLSILFGAVLAYFILDKLQHFIPTILALAASSMIYVSISDLIPGLHKKTSAKDSVLQVLLIIFGASIIFIIHHYVH